MGQTKKLGLGSGIAVCVGLIVATSCLLSLGQGFGLASTGFILPLFIVVILNSFIAISFAELNSIMPNMNGGVGQYTLIGMGPVASIISNISAYVLTMIFATSVELSMCGMVLHEIFPNIPTVVFSVAILVILFTLNLYGLDVFSKIQNIVVILLIGSMAVMGILSFFKLGTGVPITADAMETPAMTGIGDLIGLAPIAFWLFIGVEFIIPVAKDLKNPKRNVLLSMILALLILFVVQAILGTGMTNYVKLSVLSESDMPHMVFAENLFGYVGKIWMGLITLLAAISTLNTILPSTAKILQGMAEENMVPSVFKKINNKNVPVAGMLLVAVVDFLMIITGYVNSNGLVTMILAGSCFWLTSYIMTHINVLLLRKRYPNAPRNKKLILFGIPQILGILGNIYMIWNISSDMDSRIEIYKIFTILFVILACYACIWVKFVMKMELFRPVRVFSTRKLNSTTLQKE